MTFFIGFSAYGDEASLERAIQEAEAGISRLNSYISNTNSQIRSAELEEQRLNAEKAEYDRKKIVFQTQHYDNTKKNEATIAEGQKLAAEVTELLKKIGEENYKIKNLTSLNEKFIYINQRYQSIDALHEQITSLSNSFEDQNKTWLAKANSHLNSKKPDFNSIVDKESYKQAYTSALQASGSFPSMGELLSLENSIYSNIKNLLLNINEQQVYIRGLASSVELSSYTKIHSGNQIETLKNIDKSYEVLNQKLGQ